MGGLATAWTTGNEGSSSTFMPTAKSALVGVLSNAIGEEGDGDGGGDHVGVGYALGQSGTHWVWFMAFVANVSKSGFRAINPFDRL